MDDCLHFEVRPTQFQEMCRWFWLAPLDVESERSKIRKFNNLFHVNMKLQKKKNNSVKYTIDKNKRICEEKQRQKQNMFIRNSRYLY